MRLVIAYIRPEKLNAVKQALFQAEILKMSISNALGCGDEPSYYENYRGAGAEVDLHKRVRLEIAVNEPFLEKTVKAIVAGAKTGDNGDVGDGKIFIVPLQECIRIRTDEHGDVAIG